MRVSPVGWFFNDMETVLKEAERSALPTHNHPEGIKGAQAIALSVFMARAGYSKKEIKTEISNRFNYNLDRTLDEIRPGYEFSATCQLTVPEAIIAFLESKDYDSAIRKAISIGGDSDTLACMAGAIAEAFYCGIPGQSIEYALSILLNTAPELLMIANDFSEKVISMRGWHIEAPFTKEQVDKLNRYQNQNGIHPFTCMSPNDIPECLRKKRDADGRKVSDGVLTATEEGWICPCGKYTQDDAFLYMIKD
jgi:hypothetical protein